LAFDALNESVAARARLDADREHGQGNVIAILERDAASLGEGCGSPGPLATRDGEVAFGFSQRLFSMGRNGEREQRRGESGLAWWFALFKPSRGSIPAGVT
jgi:hypothetical protein